jgi:hypothetical protein
MFASISPAARRIIGLLLISAVLLTAAMPTLARNWQGNKDTEDFAPIYQAARAMLSGRDIYAAADGLYIYPPLLAFLFQPLALLPEHTAAIAWCILSVIIMFSAACLAGEEATRRWRGFEVGIISSSASIVAAGAVLLAAEKIHADFRLGQTDCLMLLGLISILRWIEEKPWVAGAAVAATASMKYVTLIFLPYFIIKRNYRAAIASLAWLLVFNALPALEVGIRGATQFLASALGAIIKMANVLPPAGVKEHISRVSWDRSVSITSAVVRLAESYHVPLWAALLFLCGCFVAFITVTLLLSGLYGVRLFRGPILERSGAGGAVAALEWSILIVAALVFSPQSTARHFVLMLGVYAVGLATLLAQRARAPRIILGIALVLTSLGISFPPRNLGMDSALGQWRAIAGASWCAVVLLLLIVAIGSRTISVAEKSLQERQGIGNDGDSAE